MSHIYALTSGPCANSVDLSKNAKNGQEQGCLYNWPQSRASNLIPSKQIQFAKIISIKCKRACHLCHRPKHRAWKVESLKQDAFESKVISSSLSNWQVFGDKREKQNSNKTKMVCKCK
jgi:hypothetical protein